MLLTCSHFFTPAPAGGMIVKRPAAELVTICRRVPDLLHSSCADLGFTGWQSAILSPSPSLSKATQINRKPKYDTKIDSPEVAVPVEGGTTTLPNIHPQLMLLAHL